MQNLGGTMKAPWMVRTSLFSLAFLGFGCAGTTSPVISAVPEPVSEVPLPTTLVAERMALDSAADAEALDAMRELEFSSLTKGGDHVRGVLLPPDSGITRPSSSGGTASASVTYDFDVEGWFNHRRVQYYMDFFVDSARDRFEIWLSRLTRYQGLIHDRFRHYGVPEDMVFLALIESGYSNTAVSRAAAVGMWQFIRSTGRAYGLRIDDWVDERRDPFKATDAAARHLRDLNEQFGSWYLAAAAYNGGSTRVSRALTRMPRQESADAAYFEMAERRYIRRETRDYVPKLIAATVIAKSPGAHGFEDIEPMNALVYDEVKLQGQTGLDVVAELADTTTRALMELNPQFFRGATPPNEEVTVRVPRGTAGQVISGYRDLAVSERVNFIEHQVRNGETLGGIAQRYRVNLRYIQQANPGLNPRRLRIGYRLVVPISRAAQRGASTVRSRNARPPQRTAPPESGVHRVRSGETLWWLSQRYSVTVHELRAWNRIPENVTFLEIGQRLRVTAQN
jgi:membrane-bound lytic murein transglycosylase D